MSVMRNSDEMSNLERPTVRQPTGDGWSGDCQLRSTTCVYRRLASGVLVLCLLSGCGDGRLPTYEVTGKIVFEGQPMAGGGQILFVPLNEDHGRASTGEILPDGSFKLTTYKQGDGATLGEHRVEIWQDVVLEHAVYQYDRTDKGETEKLVSPEKRIPASSVIPTVYMGSGSPLRANVSERNDEITISLSRNPGSPSM